MYTCQGIPDDLCEAARIDGMSEYRIYASIMLPLSKPALSTLTIFTFVATWNDYLGPLIYLKSQEKKTIQLGLKMFISQYSSDYGLIMAGSVLSLIPVLIVFLVLQKYFVEGVASTGLKGTDNNVFSQACAGSMSQACIIKMHNKVKDKTMITFDEKKYPQITDAEIKDALQFSTEQVIRDLSEFTEKFQKALYLNFPGFFQPFILRIFISQPDLSSPEPTGPVIVRNRLIETVLAVCFLDRIDKKIEVDHHDMGFLYSPSCVAAYKLTGSKEGREAAIKAADQLITRYHPVGEFIQAWGPMDAPENYHLIIDCLLNLPLFTGHPMRLEIRNTVTLRRNIFIPLLPM